MYIQSTNNTIHVGSQYNVKSYPKYQVFVTVPKPFYILLVILDRTNPKC